MIDFRSIPIQGTLAIPSKVVNLELFQLPDLAQETPLHPASREGHLEVVRVVLERQALPDQADEDGLTPLHQAARSGHVDISRLLLSAGAARDPLTAGGAAPLHWAAAYGHLETWSMQAEGVCFFVLLDCSHGGAGFYRPFPHFGVFVHLGGTEYCKGCSYCPRHKGVSENEVGYIGISVK